MASIIIFSKDRPLQLHAYLESLLHFSDAKQEQISVLYYEASGISYSRVIHEFSKVNWVAETHFYKDLMATLATASDCVLFGCDDVVFTGAFSLHEAEMALTQNEACFGFSFRLGKNIKPLPKNNSKDKRYLQWNWQKTQRAHYNYPWELDATLYRTADVLNMLKGREQTISNPNYLEAHFSAHPTQHINRPLLMCLRNKSKSIVITVNRVQDTHCNPFDDAPGMDVKTLSQLYNEQNKTMDVLEIAKLKHKLIHVGSEYFILNDN